MKSQIALFLAFCVLAPARADMSYRSYQQTKGQAATQAHVAALGSGVSWGISFMNRDRSPVTVCPPEIVFNRTNYEDFVERGANLTSADLRPSMPIALLMLEGMKSAFPCR